MAIRRHAQRNHFHFYSRCPQWTFVQNVAAKPISWRAEHWVLGGVALLLTALVGIVIPGWANATRHDPAPAAHTTVAIDLPQLPGTEADPTIGAYGLGASSEPEWHRVTVRAGQSLADIFHEWGDERKARPLAREVVRRRARAPFAVSDDFVNAIRSVLGPRSGPGDFARLFQALRIAVNDEFGQLVEGLYASERLLTEGGRLAVVTFHSLEDRIVKRFFDPEKGAPTQSRHLPQVVAEAPRWIDIARAVKPSEAETSRNPRARSAILRAAHRSSAPARAVSFDNLGVPRFRGAA